MSRTRQTVDRPKLACEITATAVAAARLDSSSYVMASMYARDLPPGALVPSLTAQNVHNAGALTAAVRDVVTSAAGHPQELTVVLPDVAVRVALLDFDSLPEKPAEADAAVRFRLKKSLPFDSDDAALSYHVQREGESLRLVTAVMHKSVRAEYEDVIRAAGCEPGVLLSSTLAALGMVEADEPTMLLKVDPSAMSVAILSGDRLLLLRTLESSHGEQLSPERLAEDVYPSLVYFQDTFGMTVRRVLLAGGAPAHALQPVLEAAAELRVENLVGDSLADAGGRPEFAGAIGALY